MCLPWQGEYCTRRHSFLYGSDSNRRHNVEGEKWSLKRKILHNWTLFPLSKNYTLLLWGSRHRHLGTLTIVRNTVEYQVWLTIEAAEKYTFTNMFNPLNKPRLSILSTTPTKALGKLTKLSANYHIFMLTLYPSGIRPPLRVTNMRIF